jgi:hypothetical protein
MLRKTTLVLGATLVMAGSAFTLNTASADWWYYRHSSRAADIRSDLRDIQRDRADLRSDYSRLERDRLFGNRGAVARDLADIRRDQIDLRNDLRDVRRDRYGY